MGILNFYDTSALLNLDKFYNGEIYISNYVLAELENIKTSSHKDESIKYKARKVTNLLTTLNPTNYIFSYKNLNKIFNKYDFLSEDIPDHLILAEAILVEKKYKGDFFFITSDASLYNFSKKFPQLKSIYLSQKDGSSFFQEKEEYFGWRNIYPSSYQMNSLYTNPNSNIFEAKTNEYLKIYENGEIKDLLKWDGTCYQHLNYKPITSAVGEKWKPLNPEQKMLFDLLQNDDIPIKLALGNYGSGKTSLMLSHALDGIQKGKYDKIVFIRNNIEVKDTTPLGALPNGETDKLLPYLMPICDHVGEYMFDGMLKNGTIEACHLGFIRGREFKNSIMFVDEAENLTASQIQLLIGRIGKNSMLFIAGDLRQTDKISFEKNSGLKKMIERLQNNKLFGMVKLQQSVRSDVCKLADLMD